MAASQQSLSARRDSSIVPTIPGVHAFVAVVTAVGCTLVGVGIDAARGSELTRVFEALYVLGCLAAVLLVRYAGLFTAAVQPPLILFVAVPMAYQYMSHGGGTSLKDILLNDAIPLVDRFPMMAAATVLVLIVAGIRVLLDRKRNPEPKVRASRAGRNSAKDAKAKQAKPDTVKDKLDRISAKANALKSQGSGAQSGPIKQVPQPVPDQPAGRLRRPDMLGAERPARPERGPQPGPVSRPIPRRDPRAQPPAGRGGDPRYPQGPPPPPNRVPPPPRPRPDGPPPSHPMPNVRYRDRDR